MSGQISYSKKRTQKGPEAFYGPPVLLSFTKLYFFTATSHGTVLFSQPFTWTILFSQSLHTTGMRRSLPETGNVPGRFFHCEMIDCECSDKNDQRHRRG